MPMKPHGAMALWGILYGSQAMKPLPSFISTGIGLPRWLKSSSRAEQDVAGARPLYAAYNGIGVERQTCIAHIITKAKEVEGNMRCCPRPRRTRCSAPSATASWISAPDSATRDRESSNRRYSLEGGGQSRKTLCQTSPLPSGTGQLVSNPPRPSGPISQDRPEKFLFTFLRRPACPAYEQSRGQFFRHLVIFRKICLGTRSKSGLKTHSILPSLVQTAKTRRPSKEDYKHSPHRRSRQPLKRPCIINSS